jgi:sirohydrochlorin ferrochelatase
VRAVILVGYGSVLPGIGTAMIRLAARIESAGIADIAAAAFIAGCRPGFHEALERCVQQGASEIVVQPYTLVEDEPVRRDLRKLVEHGATAYPKVSIRMARPLGDHPALAAVALQRASEADYAASHGMHRLPLMNAHEQIVERPPATLYHRRADGKGFELIKDRWRPMYVDQPTGLVLVAHGSPKPAWDWPISAAAEWIRINARYESVNVGFIQHNRPSVPMAIELLANRGLRSLILVPFMLQLTASDADYLTSVANDAESRYNGLRILVADHLNYDRQLLKAIEDRTTEVINGNRRRLPIYANAPLD